MTKEEMDKRLDSAISSIMADLDSTDEIVVFAEAIFDMADAIKAMVISLAKEKGLAAVAGVDIPKEG